MNGITREALAHIDNNKNPHLLIEHLQEVGEQAAQFASGFDSAEWARLQGRWHDLGKYALAFQKMIREANGIEAHIEQADAQGPRDHSTAGAVHAMKLGPIALPIAFGIAGHHAGLANRDELTNRLEDKKQCYALAQKGHPPAEILKGALPPLPPLLTRLERGSPQLHLRFEMWIRMLFSCLCDADFLDTEAFFNSSLSGLRSQFPSLQSLEPKLHAYLHTLQHNAPPTPVNQIRAEILSACLNAASLSPGAFSLTVPTGGGKTLSSMAFALAHARLHQKQRVIAAIPFTSIIEQNADIYRNALGGDAIIEHHSAFDPRKENAHNRIAADNWDAPIVVTTTVRLFESLFSNRPSACRRLHNLVNSIIILDEAQSLPVGLLDAIVDGLGTLISDYGVSLVISTATQPALGSSKKLSYPLQNVREIVPDSLQAFERLKRVQVRWPSSPEPISFAKLAQEAAQEQDVLCIVHRRDDAQILCKAMDQTLGHQDTVHLSALMCPEHRSTVLARLKRQKEAGKPVRAVSTQLVEAGVDIDFAIVYRALGGMDAMAQAAGRCNREGKLPGLGELRVFRAKTEAPPGVLTQGLSVTDKLLRKKPDLDLFSPETHRDYFRGLYAIGSLDEKKIQEKRANKQFRDVAESFQMIDDEWSAPLVIPYEKGAELLNELENFGPSRELLRKLQRFTISVPKQQRETWIQQQFCAYDPTQTVVFLKKEFARAYDDRFGLITDDVGIANPASLIVENERR